MSKNHLLQQITPILKYYGLTPHFAEGSGKVIRVYADKGGFALKRIPVRQGTDFIRQVQNLFQKGFNRIVPIYPTLDGRYALKHGESLYYLMPWLANEVKEDQNQRHHQMFRELARIHTLSVKEVAINKEDKQKHYENTLYNWEKDREFVEGYIEHCEGKFYLSPYELLFCLYYHDISQAIQFSKNKFKEWYEKTKDDEKARAVITHGKVSLEHFIYDDRGHGYFLNFEKSRQGSPMHDLLPFLSRNLYTYPKRSEECVDWIYTYFKFFPPKEDELLLFLSYFAYPAALIRAVEGYYKERDKHERKAVQQLQRQYWLLKNTEYIVMRMDEIERQKKLEAEAQAEAQSEDGAQS